MSSDWPMDWCPTCQGNPHFPDGHSLYVDLCSVFYDGLRHSGTQAVYRRVQTLPAGYPGRGRPVPFPVHCGELPIVRRASQVSAVRGAPRPAQSSGCETGAEAGGLRCSTPMRDAAAEPGSHLFRRLRHCGPETGGEKQVNVRVVPTGQTIDESIEAAQEIFKKVFRRTFQRMM